MEENKENEPEQKTVEEEKVKEISQELEEEKAQEPPIPQNTDTKSVKVSEEPSPVRKINIILNN
jgi:hypothetical protein